jgi:hypothetical protein
VEVAKAKDKEKIKLLTIDGYCERKGIKQIDLLKVDVEGHELAVFKGMTQMLKQDAIKIIQFEYGGCNLDARVYLADIWSFLEAYGFKFYKLYPEGAHRIIKYSQQLETFKYSNWVCLK